MEHGGKESYLLGTQIDENVVILGDGMGVGRTRFPSSLEVLAVRKTGVDVVVGEGDGAESLEIEIEGMAIDLDQEIGD